MASISFWAKTTSSSANAPTLVVSSSPAVSISFTNDNPNIPGIDNTGDLVLESTNGAPDPDTWVTINGQTYTFTYDISGNLPAGTKVPAALVGKTVAVIIANNTTYFFPLDGSGSQSLMNSVGNGNIRLTSENPNPPPVHVCFCAGTQIDTPAGPRLVERLQAGDLVLTATGQPSPVLWVGRSQISADELAANPKLCPIRIPAYAFAAAGPNADLFLSPQHRIAVRGAAVDLMFAADQVLVAARFLVGSLAEQTQPDTDIEYFHLLLAEHEILVANGLDCESFQPSQRTVDILSEDCRARLMQAVNALGAADLLVRKDACLSLNRAEGEVLGLVLSAPAPALIAGSICKTA